MGRLLILAVFMFVTGCGYSTTGSMYAGNKIIIKPVVNKIDITSEQRRGSNYVTFPILLENRLTNTIINKFNTDGSVKVVNQDTDALTLECNITDYTKETLRYTGADDVEEQRLHLYVQVKFTSDTGQVITDKVVVGETTYYLSGAHSKSESVAQEDLVDDTARRISEIVLEAW